MFQKARRGGEEGRLLFFPPFPRCSKRGGGRLKMQPAPPSSLPQFISPPLFPGRPPASKGNLIAFIKVSIVGAVATRKGRRKQLLGLTKHLPLFFHRYGRLRRLHLPSHPVGIVRRRAGRVACSLSKIIEMFWSWQFVKNEKSTFTGNVSKNICHSWQFVKNYASTGNVSKTLFG